MKKIRLFKLSLFTLAFLQCQVTNAQQKKPNIIWITCEDISPYIGAYGNKLVKTPNIDQLAKEGIRYTSAYTTAGVCAPSRSAIVTGMYQTSIGSMHMRAKDIDNDSPIGDTRPRYNTVVPDYVKCFPEYLRMAGYYCTNNEKRDYQFNSPVTAWDENSPAASFRNCPKGKPFFSVFNFSITHESQLWMQKDSLLVNGAAINVPPIYPDTKIVHHDIARLFTNITRMDKQVGELIAMLKADGLYDNTIIFFYSDHGGALPWMKRELLERGTHIPLIIRFPGAKNVGTVENKLISSVDFAPTVLSLANIKVPEYMQGQAFLGNQKAKVDRKYVFAGRDRMDERYDRVRMVRDKRFRYLYNYMPELPYYQNITYRLQIPMMQEILKMKEDKTLGKTTMSWFNTKPVEELYDMENDPYELNNLAADPKYKDKLVELRTTFQNWTKKVGDMGGIPEKEMIKQMWNGGDVAPTTAQPNIVALPKGVKITCATKGASVGYRIQKAGNTPQVIERKILSWDYPETVGAIKNGEMKEMDPIWKVYTGEIISLQPGDILYVNAMRIGYDPSEIAYTNGKTTIRKPKYIGEFPY